MSRKRSSWSSTAREDSSSSQVLLEQTRSYTYLGLTLGLVLSISCLNIQTKTILTIQQKLELIELCIAGASKLSLMFTFNA